MNWLDTDGGSMLSDAERKRIVAILGMLGSDHAGERDNAAQQAEAFRRKHGLTWAELIALLDIMAPPSDWPMLSK